jgi:hypothetical protein
MMVWMDGKGPNEDSDIDIDWTVRLNGDTITSSSWEIVGTDPATPESPVALEIVSDPAPAFTNTMTKVWLSGGTLGITYVLRNTVNTAAGEQPLTEMVELPMRNR